VNARDQTDNSTSVMQCLRELLVGTLRLVDSKALCAFHKASGRDELSEMPPNDRFDVKPTKINLVHWGWEMTMIFSSLIQRAKS